MMTAAAHTSQHLLTHSAVLPIYGLHQFWRSHNIAKLPTEPLDIQVGKGNTAIKQT
jgi:hypothetical protein